MVAPPPNGRPTMSTARRLALAVGLCALVAGARLPLVRGPGLWADEVFSLAMATGHSLEHPAADADAALGDFVEPRGSMPAGAWGRYLEPETPAVSVGRVVRAVLKSDTSPPLYYVVLARWIRLAGPGDAALRLFSIAWAVAAAPLLWLLACRLGGIRAAVPTLLLYAFAPTGLYYSGEGRMYSLLWFLALGFAWLSLRLHDRGPGLTRHALWTLAGAAGLLTHYFFAFAWMGCLLWLCLHPGRSRRPWIAAAVCATVLLALPWYVRVPDSLGAWRVTGDWLAGHITLRDAVVNPLKLGWSLLSGRGIWGGSVWANRVAQAGFLLVLLLGWRAERWRLPDARTRLVWFWIAGVTIGPVVFDVARGSSTSMVFRYALAGLPAAALLVGLALSRLRQPVSAGLVALLLLAWTPGISAVLGDTSRYRRAYRDAAETASRWAGPSDLVIVHSIPSGVLGVARYLPPSVPLAAWVGQLGQRRVPEDVRALANGRRRVVFVRIHDVGAPAPEEDWLRAHGRLIGQGPDSGPTVLAFEGLPGLNAVEAPVPPDRGP